MGLELIFSSSLATKCDKDICIDDLSTRYAVLTCKIPQALALFHLLSFLATYPANPCGEASLFPVRSGFLWTRHAPASRTTATQAGKRFIVYGANSIGDCASHGAQRTPKRFLLQCLTCGYIFPSMPQLPTCGNFLAGTCEKSDVYVSKETDSAFVIYCRTCKSANIWPKEKDEAKGRYEAFLKFQGARQAQHVYESSRPAFSLPTSGDE